MSMVGKPKHEGKAKCCTCGDVANVKLFYNYKLNRYRYFCSDCSQELEKEWLDANEWHETLSYATDLDDEEWDEWDW